MRPAKDLKQMVAQARTSGQALDFVMGDANASTDIDNLLMDTSNVSQNSTKNLLNFNTQRFSMGTGGGGSSVATTSGN